MQNPQNLRYCKVMHALDLSKILLFVIFFAFDIECFFFLETRKRADITTFFTQKQQCYRIEYFRSNERDNLFY